MGILDKILGRAKDTAQEVAQQAGGLAEKARDTAEDLAEKHGDKVTSAVDKAAGFVDEKTGGKLHGVTEKISEGADKAVDALRGDDAEAPAADDQPTTPA